MRTIMKKNHICNLKCKEFSTKREVVWMETETDVARVNYMKCKMVRGDTKINEGITKKIVSKQ